MTYSDLIIWHSKLHGRDKRTGFVTSLSIHVLLFLLGGAVFVKTAQYSVQSIPSSTEVELVETSPEVKMQEYTLVTKPPAFKNETMIKPRFQTVKSLARVEAKPDYFQNPPPYYPELAKQMRQEGLVMLAVDVNREGLPVDVKIIKSSGYRLLDDAALKAVSRWKFVPGRIGDLPVDSKATIPIRFRLQE